ncbi:MAG: Maf family protein [Desulfovibrio sp.]|nr:Maf family protein [Desulfovibrio sp.]
MPIPLRRACRSPAEGGATDAVFLNDGNYHGAIRIFYTRCPLILASASPRRIAFLAELGLSATVRIPPPHTEPPPLRGEAPSTYALRAALAKASGVVAPSGGAACATGPLEEPALVIAADTIVALRGRILGKPRSPEHALDMLRSLAGKTHTVTTACALLKEGERRLFTVHSRVRMWACPDDLLRAYACCGEAADKAGAYAVQGMGAALVRSIAGSWSNVVGLPLAELVQALLAMDAIGIADAGTSHPLRGTSFFS